MTQESMTGREMIRQYRDEGRRDFDGVTMYGPLREANLPECSFRRAHMEGADLSNANLQGSDFSHADLKDATICGADLRGCYFTGAWLWGVSIDFATRFRKDSYDIIAEILRQWDSNSSDDGGNSIKRRMIAGVVYVSRSSCWDSLTASCPRGFEKVAEQALHHLEKWPSLRSYAYHARMNYLTVPEGGSDESNASRTDSTTEQLQEALIAAKEALRDVQKRLSSIQSLRRDIENAASDLEDTADSADTDIDEAMGDINNVLDA